MEAVRDTETGPITTAEALEALHLICESESESETGPFDEVFDERFEAITPFCDDEVLLDAEPADY